MQKIDFIEELRWRGMLNDMTPHTEKQLAQEMTAAYIGFDPTAASLHIGNLATAMLLVHFQRAGHKPYALIGGATGMVGDPSGKSEERKFLDEQTLRHNQNCIKNQLTKLLDFECGENSAVVVNNYDWFSQIGFLQFLREAGKYITVNYMMAKDSVKNRMETGISFAEFSYQLLQGYDFYYLYQNHNIKLQMGGSDQWGNITTGTEFIRRKDHTGTAQAYALTCPLITKADGTKFGKSEGGNIWLDPNMTSPYKFYQFWLNAADEDCAKLIRVFTLLDKATIEDLEAQHAQAPHLRLLQKAIAKDVTIRIHGQAEYEMAVQASEILFGKSTTENLKALDERTFLAVFEGVPQSQISPDEFEKCQTLVDLLTQTQVFASKSEAKKMLQGGGVSINKNKADEQSPIQNIDLLQGKYILVQKGKKNYYIIHKL